MRPSEKTEKPPGFSSEGGLPGGNKFRDSAFEKQDADLRNIREASTTLRGLVGYRILILKIFV